MSESPLAAPRIVDKPWGREIWYADNPPYAGKVLEVKAGRRLSLQLHEVKEETLYLLSGLVKLTFVPAGDDASPSERTFEWRPGQFVHIPPRTVHRFEAVEDAVLLEVSTPHLTDVIRLEDDYARPKTDQPQG
ncbi:MAG TPA: cupin domain-containing protein [Deinococcales bacterium]|nr:cupin domain-containing protein [Deinococcales bacterium]